jgi:hypothetical protein
MATAHATAENIRELVAIVAQLDRVCPDRPTAARLDVLAAAWLFVAAQAQAEALPKPRAGEFPAERARQVAQLHTLLELVSKTKARDYSKMVRLLRSTGELAAARQGRDFYARSTK